MPPSIANTLIRIALFLPFLAVGVHASDLYWTEQDTGRIMRADLGTLAVEAVIPGGLVNPYRIALDPLGRKMYWTNVNGRQIQRANLDGSGIETIVQFTGSTWGIAVDGLGGKVYWSSAVPVWRANLDGSQAEQVFLGGAPVQDLALDPAAGKVYASSYSANRNAFGRLQRANLDGSELENVGDRIHNGPVGLGVDHPAGKVYWARFWPEGGLQRANLDGSQVEDLLTDISADSLALDFPGGKVYWSELDLPSFTGSLWRANLDGSEAERLPFGGTRPGGIAIIPEPGTLLLLIGGSIVLTRRRS